MGKYIQCPEDKIQDYLQRFEEALRTKKFSGNEKSLNVKIPKDDRQAELIFSPAAWTKMLSLVDGFDGEVQWHGTVERLTENSFIVTDIIVFPHEVTSATVTSNQEEYNNWINELDDNTFNKLRFHGHSHVKMGVSPSATDNEYRKKILNNLGKPSAGYDAFYTFLIINKDGKISSEIYDLTNNVVYDTDDTTVSVKLNGSENLSDFLKVAHSLAKKPVQPKPVNYNNYSKKGNGTTGFTTNNYPYYQEYYGGYCD